MSFASRPALHDPKVLALADYSMSIFCGFLIILTGIARAYAVASPEEVSKLSSQLTPMGGLRAGNIEGTIPPWTGGITSAPPGYIRGRNYINPFVNDAVQFVITRSNYQAVADKLTTGHKALLNTHPGYKLNIYPTHRSASYSAKVYAAARKNALSATMLPRSAGVVKSKMTSPFPLASSAEQMLWNHSLRYRGQRMKVTGASVSVSSRGNYSPTLSKRELFVIYAQPELDSRQHENKFIYLKYRIISPAKDAGNINLVHESIDQVVSPREAWQYSFGQRQLRRSPNLSYDSYTSESNGLRTVDQFDMFNGAPGQYKWKIVGKKELYVPYNSYALNDLSASLDDIVQDKYINQDLARYELHRVWVVEGRLRAGIKHIYGRRLIYLDEDSWQVLITEEYDQKLNLWRVQEGHAMNYYDQPLVSTAIEVVYDLQESRYFVDGIDNEHGGIQFGSALNAGAFSTAAVRREAKQ